MRHSRLFLRFLRARSFQWGFTLLACTLAFPATATRAGASTSSIEERAARIVRHPSELRLLDSTWSPLAAETVRLQVPGARSAYLVEDHLVPLVRFTVAFPVGDRDDPPGKVGVASMTAAMLRRGGTSRRSPQAFDQAVADLGADLQTHGGEGRTVVTLVCLSEVVEEAVGLLFEMLHEPAFDGERLAHAKLSLHSSFAARRDDARAVLRRRWNHLLLGAEHPRTRELTPQTLALIDAPALRAFHADRLLAAQPFVAISGAIGRARAEHLLAAQLAASQRHRAGTAALDQGGVRPPAVSVENTPRAGALAPSAPGFYHLTHPTHQGKMMLGGPGVALEGWDDERLWAAVVLQEVLDGAGVLSRLRSRLRGAESLVYTVEGLLEWSTRPHTAPPLLEVFLETDPVGALPAASAVVEEMRRLAREPLSPAELSFAQRGLVQRFPAYFQDAESTAGRYAQDDLLERPHSYWERFRDGVRSVTAAQVRRLARETLAPEDLRILWVGPPLPSEAIAAWVQRHGLEHAQELEPWDPLTLRP